MSNNAECEFIERSPSEWWYLLQASGSAFDAWDWREEAIVEGPFTSYEAAMSHLDRNHTNPGGFSTLNYREGAGEDWVLEQLIFAKQHKQRPRFSAQIDYVETREDRKPAWYALVERLRDPGPEIDDHYGRCDTLGPFSSQKEATAYAREHHPSGKHLGGGMTTPWPLIERDTAKRYAQKLESGEAQAPDEALLAPIRTQIEDEARRERGVRNTFHHRPFRL